MELNENRSTIRECSSKIRSMNLIFALVLAALSAKPATANVCGTDYQNFNPTTSGLDFVTVHSSETLRPCILNMGLFLNYSANKVSYSQTLDPSISKNRRRHDRTLAADLSAGIGLTDRWDFGVNVPFVLSQSLNDDVYVSNFRDKGATEIKANTKYHILGDQSGGLAAVLSVNKNLVRRNPFTGENPGLTWNYELVADTTFKTKWAAAVNVGYRDRHPDDPIVGVPIEPLDDQWIFSAATSYLIPQYDTKLILELYGSRAAQSGSSDSDRNLNSLEALAGFKHDYSQNMAVHFGAASQIDSGTGGAEWRIYGGLNWALGPICKTSVFQSLKETFSDGPEIYTVDLHLLFDLNSDQIRLDRMDAFNKAYREFAAGGFERLAIAGHTDSVGSAEYNLDLSQRRANSVRRHLIKHHGVPPAKIEAKGYGEEIPVADNGNYQGRQKNRRVEFKIWRKK